MAIFSPSMMCAEFSEIKEEVRLLEEAGADRFHLDVMDGRFVPSFALGMGDVRCICTCTEKPKELHLMIENPGRYVELFASAGVDIIYFHPESDYHPTTVIEQIKKAGAEPGIVLNPGTSIEAVTELLYIVKRVIVMGVNPGHAGQIYLPYVDHKLSRLIGLKKEYGLEITLDGACSADMIKKWSGRGVDGFVLGTTALFGLDISYADAFHELRSVCGD